MHVQDFKCRNCQSVLGYQSDRLLILSGLEFEKHITFRCSCGAVNRWYPAAKVKGKKSDCNLLSAGDTLATVL